MVVVAHVLAHRPAPMAVGEDVLGPADRLRADGLDREAASEPAALVGLVELLGGDLGGRGLVHPHRVREAAGDLRRPLDHDVAPDLIGVVAEAVREAGAGRIEHQPRGLDRVAGDRDGGGALEALLARPVIGDAGASIALGLDPDDVGVGADLDPVLDRVGQVGDQRGRLRVDLAALQAEAPVDAVRAVAEGAVGDPDRADPHLDPGRMGPGAGTIGSPRDRMGAVGIAVRIAPGPVLPGDRQLPLHPLVMRLQLPVGDRPVGADAVPRPDLEVGGMEARRVAGVMDHRAADPVAAVVLAQLHRVSRRRSREGRSSRACGSRPRRRPSRGRDPRTGPTRRSRSASRAGRAAAPGSSRRLPHRRSTRSTSSSSR